MTRKLLLSLCSSCRDRCWDHLPAGKDAAEFVDGILGFVEIASGNKKNEGYLWLSLWLFGYQKIVILSKDKFCQLIYSLNF